MTQLPPLHLLTTNTPQLSATQYTLPEPLQPPPTQPLYTKEDMIPEKRGVPPEKDGNSSVHSMSKLFFDLLLDDSPSLIRHIDAHLFEFIDSLLCKKRTRLQAAAKNANWETKNKALRGLNEHDEEYSNTRDYALKVTNLDVEPSSYVDGFALTVAFSNVCNFFTAMSYASDAFTAWAAYSAKVLMCPLNTPPVFSTILVGTVDTRTKDLVLHFQSMDENNNQAITWALQKFGVLPYRLSLSALRGEDPLPGVSDHQCSQKS